MNRFLFLTLCCVILSKTEGDRLLSIHRSSWLDRQSTHYAFTNTICNNLLVPVAFASKWKKLLQSHSKRSYSRNRYLRRQHDVSCFMPRFQGKVVPLAVESVNEYSLYSSKAPNDFVQNDDLSKNKLAIKSFIEEIGKSIQERTFVSISAKGVNKSEKTNKRSITNGDLRGRIRLVAGRLIALKSQKKTDKQKVSLQVTFKYHLATDIVKNWDISPLSNEVNTKHSTINEVQLGFESLFGISVDNTINRKNRNLIPNSEWDESDQEQPTAPNYGIKSATLELNDGRILELNLGKPSLHWKKVSVDNTSKQTQSSNEIATHDRAKNVPLAMTESFWQALGITIDESGKPVGGMSSKVRQCQKFVEIMDKLIEQRIAEYIARSGAMGGENSHPTISVVDMGCGRGYLTFGLHSFLHNKYAEKVQSRGIDVRPKLVKEINSIAQRLGGKYESLRFETGTIASFLSEQSEKNAQHPENSDEINVIIALHACDTATDDAIWSGISSQADIIVVAPCCHKEIRPQLNKHAKVCGKNHPLYDILRHNIYRERIAETVTDSLRALFLELAGYSVQVFEFIGGEHTSKNVMITGIRQQQQQHRTDDEKKKDNIRLRIRSLAALHGIQQHTLAQHMNEYLTNLDNDDDPQYVLETGWKMQYDGTEKSSYGLIDTKFQSSRYRSMPSLPSGEAP